MKDKNNFFIKSNIAFLLEKKTFYSWRYIFLKIPKNLIASAFFLAERDTKKHRYASAKASNAALVKRTE